MRKLYMIGGGVAFFCLVLIIVLALSLRDTGVVNGENESSSAYFTSCDNPQRTSEVGTYTSAAVSTDAIPCGSIATDILRRNGTAADAAIAAMFCVGVINAQSSGLGGGFVATYYSQQEGKAYSLDAREVAPKAATPTMYDSEHHQQSHDSDAKWYEKKPPNIKGGLSVAVPGEVAGLYELYKRFGGGLRWRELIEPTIKICEDGYQLTWYTGGIMYPMRADILAEPSMSILMNSSEGRILNIGETVFRKELARTLRVLQDDPHALSNGSLAQSFIEDLKKFGGIMTLDDLRDYRPVWREPSVFHLQNGNFTLHTFPPPGSGLILGLILNILDEFNLTSSSMDAEEEEMLRTHQRFAESFKFSYSRRSQLGDLPQDELLRVTKMLTSDDFAESLKNNINDSQTSQDPSYYGSNETIQSDDHGTAHLSLIAPNGDAIAITSSINYAFGAGIRSESTGIIYNNQMGDFSTDKPEKTNKNTILPGKRPLSSMCPSVFVDEAGKAKLVLGAAGGLLIPSAAAWVAARHLWMGQDLKSAIDGCRSHHSLIPMSLQYETGFPKPVLEAMKERGHKVKEYRWKSVVNAVSIGENGGPIVANYDYRKSGQVSGF